MKNSVWKPIMVFAATAAICVTPSLVRGDQSEKTTPATPAVEQTISTPPVCYGPFDPNPVPDYQLQRQYALDYMRSPERIATFEADFRQAGVLIAKGLDAGKFSSTTKRYDDWKQDRKPGYTGWGGISTMNNDYYAWVWWNPNGSISYTKMGVTGLSLTGGGTHLQIEMLDSGEGPYRVFLNNGSDITRVTSVYFSGNALVEDYQYPRNLSELIQLDEDARAALDYTMTLNFGVNWRQLR